MNNPLIERPIDPIFVDIADDRRVELRIGRPIKSRFGERGGGHWVVPSLLDRSASLSAHLTPDEARVLGHALLAAADMLEKD
jgi:hypothetical protein